MHPRLPKPALLAATLVLLLGPGAQGAEAPGALRSAPPAESSATLRGAPDPAAVPKLLHLPPAEEAAPAEVTALRAQPTSPGVPYRNGFARSGIANRVEIATATGAWIDRPVGTLASISESTASWYGRFVVEGAHAFRVRLADVALPKSARIRLHAGGVQLGPYGLELLDPDGHLWLPPAPGPEVVVEVELPTGSTAPPRTSAFTVGEVMEILDLDPQTEVDPSFWADCDVDAQCVSTSELPTIDALREAVARLSFVDGSFSYLCSGGLLNDTEPSGFRPFLLTANHCFHTQASASSLVAYFDYRTDGCNGSVPSLFSVPSVAGATLLASDPVSDFTLVELSANPSGTTWYLGWTTVDPGDGASMERVSHPSGSYQRYSASAYTGLGGILCDGFPVGDFHYSGRYQGSTTGGSSGAPVTQDYGGEPRVVGQLLGACHYLTWDDCDYDTYNNLDGAFSTTYPFIRQWIDPAGCEDAYEPDDSAVAASPISSGSPQSRSLCPAGDEDWATFTLTAEAGVTLETSGPTGDTRMWLYDASLTEIELDDDSGTSLFSAIDRLCGVDPLPAGTYYVRVDEYLGDNEIHDYELAYERLGSCAGSCPTHLALSATTLTGTASYRADDTITLGPSLVVHGSDIEMIAGQRVVIGSGTVIGGSFSAGTDAAACSL